MHESLSKERYACLRPTIANAQPLFRLVALFGARKIFRDGLLIVLQDVHAEALLPLHKRQQLRVLVHADQNQQRVQRNGCEGVRSHAVHAAWRALCGDYRDSGGELAERKAKLRSGWGGRRHGGSF
jgi:hypothetical protein